MFYEHQTYANFARDDQFATIKIAKPKLLLVNAHDPCQNAIVRSQRVLIWLIHKGFSPAKYSSNTVVEIKTRTSTDCQVLLFQGDKELELSSLRHGVYFLQFCCSYNFYRTFDSVHTSHTE